MSNQIDKMVSPPSASTHVAKARRKPSIPVAGYVDQASSLNQSLETTMLAGHSFGNIGVHYGSPPIQPKLTIGPVNDPYEQEADRVAAQVVSQVNTPTAQRQEKPEDEEKLQTKPLVSSIQRQETPEEEEKLQTQPIAKSLQRQEEPEKEEEQVQTKPLDVSIQRQETPEEEEKLQTKPIAESLQRQEEPEKDEEQVQTKPLAAPIQRQETPEEEEKLQTKPIADSLQRQEELEKEEDQIQTKPLAASIQRQEMPEEEEELQTKPLLNPVQRQAEKEEDQLQTKLQRQADGSMAATPSLESAISGMRGSGQSLPDSTRQPMEQAFGADFSKVKVHTDAQADQLNRSVQAQAFTTGQDIFFKQGEHSPNTLAGQELLAHELTHVVQQAASSSHGANKNTSVARSVSRELQSWPVQKQPQSPATVSGGAKWENLPEQKEFLERVLRAHIQRSQKRRKEPLPDLSGAELDPVSGTGIKMRKDAANAASELIAAANQDLAAAKAALDQDAQDTIRISATSGYRGRSHQENLWRQYFTRSTGYYNRTSAKRAKLPGGEHGDGAVSYMVGYIGGKIAPPGFSNHQAGLAIDLLQIRTKGNEISNSTDAAAVERWQSTWFFRWLQNHASTFHFEEYGKEPWHWTYRGQSTASGGAAGAAGNTPSVSSKTPTLVETPPQTTPSASGNEQTWVEKAVKQNASVGQTLGWATRIDEIVARFQQLGLLPPLQTPGSEGFAEAVKQYQNMRPPLGQDGVLGRNTWRQLSTEIGNTTDGSSQTDRKQEKTSSDLIGAPWIPIAKAEIGMKEIKGTKHNPRVVEYLQTTGKWWSTDETPWCSGFVNWVMAQSGIAGTGSAKAISWLTWGRKVEKPAYGAIGIISYGGGKGHVGFVVGKQGNNILLLGGNQSDQVKISSFARSKFSAFVFPSEYEVPASAFELEESDRSHGKEASFETTR